MSSAPQQRRRSLTNAERLVCIGAGIVFASLFLPWYGISFTRLSASGFDSFGFGAAALLVTAAAAVAAVVREASGRPPARPFRTAELVMVAGFWATMLGIYLFFDRPDRLGASTNISPRLGVYVAIAGAAVIVFAGFRMRAER